MIDTDFMSLMHQPGAPNQQFNESDNESDDSSSYISNEINNLFDSDVSSDLENDSHYSLCELDKEYLRAKFPNQIICSQKFNSIFNIDINPRKNGCKCETKIDRELKPCEDEFKKEERNIRLEQKFFKKFLRHELNNRLRIKNKLFKTNPKTVEIEDESEKNYESILNSYVSLDEEKSESPKHQTPIEAPKEEKEKSLESDNPLDSFQNKGTTSSFHGELNPNLSPIHKPYKNLDDLIQNTKQNIEDLQNNNQEIDSKASQQTVESIQSDAISETNIEKKDSEISEISELKKLRKQEFLNRGAMPREKHTSLDFSLDKSNMTKTESYPPFNQNIENIRNKATKSFANQKFKTRSASGSKINELIKNIDQNNEEYKSEAKINPLGPLQQSSLLERRNKKKQEQITIPPINTSGQAESIPEDHKKESPHKRFDQNERSELLVDRFAKDLENWNNRTDEIQSAPPVLQFNLKSPVNQIPKSFSYRANLENNLRRDFPINFQDFLSSHQTSKYSTCEEMEEKNENNIEKNSNKTEELNKADKNLDNNLLNYKIEQTKEIIKHLVFSNLTHLVVGYENPFDENELSQRADLLCKLIHKELKQFTNNKAKLIVNVTLAHFAENSVNLATKCFWNQNNDYQASYVFADDYIYCIVNTFTVSF
ncbi:unnamed protein product [Brachionus calyciflorus]|uniref:Uncharacterized protein n=1 Tax=Brachionus calyciflorus TaxID=104777 RepID=A0A814IXU8_9BILA|nr:unnamed protein product [Brachionus calyciflorus]